MSHIKTNITKEIRFLMQIIKRNQLQHSNKNIKVKQRENLFFCKVIIKNSLRLEIKKMFKEASNEKD